MDYYDADENGWDDDGAHFEALKQSKECLVFLIDAHDEMFAEVEGEAPEGCETFFQLSVRVASDMLRMRIISSDNDEIAVVFYGTKSRKNESSFEHVYVYLDLDVADALRIRMMEQATVNKFKTEIGAETNSGSQPGDALKYALWTASQLFESSTSSATKRIFLLTNNEDPCATSETLRTQITSRAEQLRDAKVSLSMFPLMSGPSQFNMGVFWQPVTSMLKDEEFESQEEEGDVYGRIDALFDSVRRKSYKKRALNSIKWTIGPDFEIAVQLFSMLQPANKGPTVLLDAKTNEKLISSTAYICKDTGGILTEVPLSCFEPKAKGSPFPKVMLHEDEVRSVRHVRDTGLVLLGFKPLEILKDHHQLRSSHFVYPAEQNLKGSTTVFAAFHSGMCTSGKFALCRFVRNRNAEPRLVALIPQQESIDSFGHQVDPPGFNMITLPFADDFRHPESDPSIVGKDSPKANEEQVDLAVQLLNALSLSEEFSTVDVPNPHIQRHFQVIEAIALQEPVPDVASFPDETKPDEEGMQKFEPMVNAFKSSVYGPDHDDVAFAANKTPKKSSGNKRKNGEGSEALAAAYSEIDFVGLVEQGRLNRKTVADLQLYLRFHRLPLAGRKADLVQRITAHVNSQK